MTDKKYSLIYIDPAWDVWGNEVKCDIDLYITNTLDIYTPTWIIKI